MGVLPAPSATLVGSASFASASLSSRYTSLISTPSALANARAVAGKPKIIFADEPTANLDSISSRQVIDLLESLHRDSGQTIVMVTHEREYADGCDRIFHMEDGLIDGIEVLK